MGIVAEPEEGKIYKGVITKIMDFGAFVKFVGSTEGLVHISEVKNERIASVSDFYKEGDSIWVKCLGMDKIWKTPNNHPHGYLKKSRLNFRRLF